MSPVDAMLAYYADADYFPRLIRREIKPLITKAVPFMERAKWMCVREFLASDLTVHDMMRRLGKRRPHDIYKMLFEFTKGELRTGFFLDNFSDKLDVTIELKAVPFDDDTYDVTCSIMDKIEGLDLSPLTPRESEVMMMLMENPKKDLPSQRARENWKFQKAAKAKEALAKTEQVV